MFVTEAFIVDAVRTAVGKRGGGFANEHPADMAAHVIRTVVERHELDKEAIDDVIIHGLDAADGRLATAIRKSPSSVAQR
jgi:acetyl-CoA C-acetyltransferase